MGVETGFAREAKNGFGVLLHARISNDRGAQAKAFTEAVDHRGRKTALSPQDLRERGMIRAQVSCECAKRIARVALVPLCEFGPEHLPEIHVATIWTIVRCLGKPNDESGANPVFIQCKGQQSGFLCQRINGPTDIMRTMAIGATCMLLVCATVPEGGPKNEAWLDRLAGTWEGEVGGQRYVEEWRIVDATTCEGTSTTWSGSKAVATERLRITFFAGHWLYLANPGEQGVTCFVRVTSDPDTWIFENKEHDFPKRVGYRLNDATGLTAWIAGVSDDAQRTEFQLKRVE